MLATYGRCALHQPQTDLHVHVLPSLLLLLQLLSGRSVQENSLTTLPSSTTSVRLERALQVPLPWAVCSVQCAVWRAAWGELMGWPKRCALCSACERSVKRLRNGGQQVATEQSSVELLLPVHVCIERLPRSLCSVVEQACIPSACVPPSATPSSGCLHAKQHLSQVVT